MHSSLMRDYSPNIASAPINALIVTFTINMIKI